VRRLKLLGLAFLAPPVIVLAAFAVGEGIELEAGWWGHLLQLAVAAVLAVGAWIRPRIGGPALIVLGVVPVALLLANVEGDVLNLPAVAMVFLPLVLSGAAFTMAGRVLTREASRR
jgi:hypothetical protein